MPSSTFNSDSAGRAPELHWNRVWISVCVVLLTLGISFETFGRANGYRPSVDDSIPFWSYHRRQVSDRPSQVVLLGTSRMQLGFSPMVFQDRFATTPIADLAINGSSPVATLRDLAEEDGFCGTVISSLMPSSLNSAHWDNQQAYVEHFRYSRPNQHLEPVLKAWLQSQFVVANSQNLFGIGKHLLVGQNSARYVVMQFDRSSLSDHTLVESLEKMRRPRIEAVQLSNVYRFSPFASWSKDAVYVGSLVEKIKARGGKVVFVRFPTSGKSRDIFERRYPKHVYWDQIERLTGAETIHFCDVPTLANFDCPDTSHLDYRDAPKFTAALLDELVQRGVLSDESK